MGSIPVTVDAIRGVYPHRLTKEGPFGGKLDHPDLRKIMDRNPGTPCCVQVTHALNMTGFLVSPGFKGQRRPPEREKINGTLYYFLLAVDEVENYLTDRYGPGEALHKDANGKQRTPQDIKKYIDGRPGLLVMIGIPKRDHTEFWTGTSFVQPGMAVDTLLSMPRVVFWDCTLAPAKWLQDFMATQ